MWRWGKGRHLREIRTYVGQALHLDGLTAGGGASLLAARSDRSEQRSTQK
jgi:hypothetical protein